MGCNASKYEICTRQISPTFSKGIEGQQRERRLRR